MNTQQILKDAEERMEKALDVFRNDLKGLRTGRASPGMLDALRVEYYGSPTPIKQIASVTTPDAQSIVIKPYQANDLKGAITAFAHRMFGPERQVRIRSSYFPFTEPSIEVDIDWPKDDPNRDRLTKGTGWLEIMGAGMVHPNVLKAGGYDPDKVTGFAFGMGPQRMLMLKHAIDDIRLFWQNDLRFLRQF